MSKIFFLSYACPGQDDVEEQSAIDSFFRDLSKVVRRLLTQRPDPLVPVGFRDTGGLMAGSPDWVRDLSTRLDDYPIGLVLLGPQYLSAERPWCHWEFTNLARRNAWADENIGSHPRLLLVINWVPARAADYPSNYPKDLQFVQESIGSSDEEVEATRWVNRNGLLRASERARNNPDDQNRYGEFINALAQYVVTQYELLQPMLAAGKRLPKCTAYDSNEVWTESLGRTNAKGVPPIRIQSSKKVVVIYVAARPDEVRPLKPDRSLRYEADGESDWRAFAPATQARVGELVRKMEQALPGIEIERYHFQLFAGAMDRVLTPNAAKHPVLIIVDPWTATQIQEYLSVLKKCAEADLKRIAFTFPIVIWNNGDPDLGEVRQSFKERVAQLFSQQRWEEVTSEQDFAECFGDAVRSLQRRIRNALAEERPDSSTSPPQLNAVAQ